MNAARTDEVFPEYLIEKETDIAAANQNITNSSLQGNSAPHKLPDGNSKEASKEALTLRGGGRGYSVSEGVGLPFVRWID